MSSSETMPFRIGALILLVSAISISGYFRARAARTQGTIDRLEEGKVALLIRIAVGLPLVTAVLVYVVRPTWLDWSRVPLPSEVRWTGLAFGMFAVVGATWALATLGGNISPTVLTREDQELVTRGPYRWIRHPLYASGILLLFSIGVMAENLFIIGWVLMGLLLLVLVVIPREERELLKRFGTDYAEYQRRSRALVPLPRIRE